MAIGAPAGGIGKIIPDAAADLFPAEVVNISPRNQMEVQ